MMGDTRTDYAVHSLKTWPRAFQGLLSGLKTHEVRLWDRPYTVGDKLQLLEWDPELGQFTGRELWREITWITDPSTYGMLNEVARICAMSVQPCQPPAGYEIGLDPTAEGRDP